jgi:hypothetical protein
MSRTLRTMDLHESPLLDSVGMDILSTAYLLRPRTEAELAAALGEPPADLDERLAALEAGGFLRRRPEGLEYESPYAVFIAIGEARARRLIAENHRTVALMEALPQLIRAWDLGTASPDGDHPLAVSLINARSTSYEEWFRHAEAERPTRPSMVVTDEDVLRVALESGHLEHLQTQLDDAHVRVLAPADPTWGADLAGLMHQARAVGVEFRRSEQAESWVYVDAPSLVALPVWWGSGTPESAIAIRTPPVVAALDQMFSLLWATSNAWTDDDEPWVDVLRLLSSGLTDDSVARSLGTTSRTVRRRIAEAMRDLGATSRFTLGMAWRARSD